MGRYNYKDNRVRNWATVIYDDSGLEKLSELKIPCLISPWHDKDINATGEQKKPHRHVMFMFEGKKSKEQIQEICEFIGGVGCEPIQSMRAYGRYLCHLDNPEKAQYDINDVVAFGGVDYIELINSVSDEFATLYDLLDYLLDNHTTSMRDFLLYCRENRQDWYQCIIRHRHIADVQLIIKANLIDNLNENK